MFGQTGILTSKTTGIVYCRRMQERDLARGDILGFEFREELVKMLFVIFTENNILALRHGSVHLGQTYFSLGK